MTQHRSFLFSRLVPLFLLLQSPQSIHALSNGAVGCEGGRAAVSGLHTSQGTVLTGPLSKDEIELQINGTPLQPGVPFDIEIGVDYNWKLITAGTFFRGFLIRMGRGDGNVDTRSSFTVSGPTAQVATTSCVDAYQVGGVTHNSNALKNLEQGTLTVHLPSNNMPLDVTVVIQNRNGYSIYYYSQFTLHASPSSQQGGGPPPQEAQTNPAPHATPTYTPYFPPPTANPSPSSTVLATPVPAPLVVTPSPVPATTPPVPATQPPVPATQPPVPVPATQPPVPATQPPVPATQPPVPATQPPVPATSPPIPVPATQPPVPVTLPPVVQYLFLRYPTCGTTTPCSVCQGDCDSDAECTGTLECFHRPQDDTSPVPGCVGAGVAGRDYCYAPQPNSLRPRVPECSVDDPCPACYGDCDDDTQCSPGLSCFLRGAGELSPVFGCSGLGIAGLDYCYNATAVSEAGFLAIGDREDNSNSTNATVIQVGGDFNASEPLTVMAPAPGPAPAMEEEEDFSSSDQMALSDTDPDENPCTSNAPCKECVGDCDSDHDNCEGELQCFVRPKNDLSMVPGCPGTGTAGTDYCWHPVQNVLAIRTEDCSKDEPCARCEGECKNDNECADDLTCYRRQDLDVVPGCGNGFRAVNFCFNSDDLTPGGRHLLRH